MIKDVNRQRLVQYFFFGIFLILLYQMALILSPFSVALLGSAILAVIVFPLHARVLARLKNHPGAASALTTTLVILIVVIPVSLFGWVFLKETSKVYPAARDWMEQVRRIQTDHSNLAVPEPLKNLYEKSQRFLEFWNIDLQDIFLKNLDELSSKMTHMATTLIKDTVFIAFNLLVLAFTLFFFLKDGPLIIARLTELVPMAESHKKVILERIQDTLYGVLRGVLTAAALQGFLTGLGFALFHVPFPVLLGVLTTLLAPIPIAGAMGVWLPVAGCLFLAGQGVQALSVTLWSLVVIGIVDHLVRPLLIGAHAKIPILLLFFGLLGGLRVYGFVGLLLGPVIIALVLAFINIYRQEYHWLLYPDKQ